MMYNTYYCKSDLEHIQKTDQVHGQYAIDLGQITCPIANSHGQKIAQVQVHMFKQSWAPKNGLYLPI
jgi:hypothetical protein